MINAIINHKDKTAVIEFPLDLYPLYQSLTDVGFQGGPHRVKLTDNEGDDTMSHGKCLTARILVFLNPENECTLSDFLEKYAPAKYWLSTKQMLKLLQDAFPDAKVIVCTPQTESPLLLQATPEDSEEKPDSTK